MGDHLPLNLFIDLWLQAAGLGQRGSSWAGGWGSSWHWKLQCRQVHWSFYCTAVPAVPLLLLGFICLEGSELVSDPTW